MKKLIHALSAIILILILLVGCQKSSVNKTEDNSLDSEGSSILEEIDFAKNDSDMFTDRDLKKSYDENNSIPILLNDNSSSANSGSVKISGDTITITEEGTYTVSGKLSDGMIIVDAPDTAKVQIVFNNVNISCSSSSPLYILHAGKVFLTLADGSENVHGGCRTYTRGHCYA